MKAQLFTSECYCHLLLKGEEVPIEGTDLSGIGVPKCLEGAA
jgi:hypothetical protein